MTPSLRHRFAAMAALGALAAFAAGCTTNPATGEQDFTPFMTTDQEIALGHKEHPKVVASLGGDYDERPAINRYVNRLGRRLQRVSEVREPPFTLTVLNSSEVNAFALPGGYLYVTRGLLALANSEAELAGVIAHEIGHVTARHAAQRYNQTIFAQLGAAVLGAATGSRLVGDLSSFGAAAYVQGYSREQELEADLLGVRYLKRAGYEPQAMAGFLATMEAESALAAKIAGREGGEPEASLFSSHPRTVKRVARAAAAASGGQPGLRVGRDDYLQLLDGILFGDDPEQGLRRGRVFAHPVLGFRFKVPPGFRMRNTPKAVLASHRNGAVVRFDGAKLGRRMSMTRYLESVWPKDLALSGIERITVNGMDAATGTTRASTREGPYDVRAIAIRFESNQIYRFLILTPARATEALSAALRRMTFSFRPLSKREIANLRPLRLRVRPVRRGDTVTSLAATLPFDDFRVERFRVLNGLAPGERLRRGRLVKLIGE